MRPAIEERADALDQLLSELQDGNAWDSTISLLADYADLVRDLMQDRLAGREADRLAVVAEIVAELRSGDRGYWTWRDKAADHIAAKFGGATMNEERIEQVARAVCCARARCEGCKGSGEGGCFDLDLWDQEAKAAIAAMQSHIAAQREDAARRALEAADNVNASDLFIRGDLSSFLEGSIARQNLIRAIDPAQFREAGNG